MAGLSYILQTLAF